MALCPGSRIRSGPKASIELAIPLAMDAGRTSADCAMSLRFVREREHRGTNQNQTQDHSA